ncbi:MAG: TrkH family potassium uptake protein [Hyphomicrobiales bacterium]
MLDLRPIVLVIGILLTSLGCAMLLPALLDLLQNHPDWLAFSFSAAITLFCGIGLTLSTWGHTHQLNVKQAFILTVLSWIALVSFAALPFRIGAYGLSITDAFFESMSGLTTTGATVIEKLDHAPPGLLLWRGLLQWIGGIGIIVMSIAVLPMLQIGGLQLFRMESSDTSEKILPRATQIAGSLTLLYFGFTLLCATAYYLCGMELLDATVHSMTTIATGGFSNHDDSIAYFQSWTVDMVAAVFMICGSLPFALYLIMLRGNPKPLYQDSQVRFFLSVLCVLIAIAWAYQVFWGVNDPTRALRLAIFNVISITTGTGYASADYGLWGGFSLVFFFCIMFLGGCAGSTSCGIKMFRFQVIFETVRISVSRMLYPHRVFSPRYNGNPLPDNVIAAVMSFFFLFFICFAALALALNLIGLDNLTSLSAAASAIANVGPGLGNVVGPVTTYADLPTTAKWVLSFGMLLGRLELFTVLVLFSPLFWRS